MAEEYSYFCRNLNIVELQLLIIVFCDEFTNYVRELYIPHNDI